MRPKTRKRVLAEEAGSSGSLPADPPAGTPPADSQPAPAASPEAAALADKLKADLATLQATNAKLETDRETALQTAAAQLAAGIERTKAAYAAAHAIPVELLSGATYEELDASLETAKGVVAKVRERVLEEAKAGEPPKVPSGGGGAAPINLADLSPREKLVLGVSGTRTVR